MRRGIDLFAGPVGSRVLPLMTAEPWVIVLAGGDGRRLAAVTRDVDGRPVPKQYWPVDGGAPMMRWAIRARMSLRRRTARCPWWTSRTTCSNAGRRTCGWSASHRAGGAISARRRVSSLSWSAISPPREK